VTEGWSIGVMVTDRTALRAGVGEGNRPVIGEGNRRLPLLDGLNGNHVGRPGLMQRQTRGDRDEIAGLYDA
jgi:hypothetical protein